MSTNFLLPPEIAAYIDTHSAPLDDILRDLTTETAELGGISTMQSAREVGGLLTFLARLVGAQQAIEVGTFTGYSAICIARGLASDGRLVCCDVSEEWTAIARKYWERAGLDDRIELRLGPAADTLAALPERPTYDLAYIDADKGGYRSYVELLYPRLRQGGIVAVDNVLWSGRVTDPSIDDDDTLAIRAFNDAVAADARWDCEMVGIGDGLTLLRKR
jgi:caffeoyl-CoA O-methyltransferase